MFRISLIGLLVVSGLGLAAAIAHEDHGPPPLPTTAEMRAEAAYWGESLFLNAGRDPSGGIDAQKRTYDGLEAIAHPFASPLPPAQSFYADTAYLAPGLGTYWIRRVNTASAAAREVASWAGPFPMPGVAGEHGLAKIIKAEVDQHADDFLVVGSNDPEPGPNGELPPSVNPQVGPFGSLFTTREARGILIGLDVHPAGSADTFTDTAVIDPVTGLYWAHRTGGFAGVDSWIGPFQAPAVVTDGEITAVRPAVLKTRPRAKRRTITIRRRVLGLHDVAAPAKVRRRDYRLSDVDLGDGIEVLKIVRATRKKLRVRIHIAPDAVPGPRTVRIKGQAADGLLTIE